MTELLALERAADNHRAVGVRPIGWPGQGYLTLAGAWIADGLDLGDPTTGANAARLTS